MIVAILEEALTADQPKACLYKNLYYFIYLWKRSYINFLYYNHCAASTYVLLSFCPSSGTFSFSVCLYKKTRVISLSFCWLFPTQSFSTRDCSLNVAMSTFTMIKLLILLNHCPCNGSLKNLPPFRPSENIRFQFPSYRLGPWWKNNLYGNSFISVHIISGHYFQYSLRSCYPNLLSSSGLCNIGALVNVFPTLYLGCSPSFQPSPLPLNYWC